MPRKPRINAITGTVDTARIEREREIKYQRRFTSLAYSYIKECENKTVDQLFDDKDFHLRCLKTIPFGEVALRHRTIYDIANTIIKVRTGQWGKERFLTMPEVVRARKYSRISDPEFFERYKLK